MLERLKEWKRSGRLLGLALILGLVPSVSWAQSLDLERSLARPGVKLLVVDVYATWCEPCMAAMPRWKALREKYREAGLRVVMVHTQDPATQCGAGVSDFADDVICDPKGYSAQWLGVDNALPAAFLWSWQGNLLVQNGHIDEVEAEIERYFQSVPRVAVEASNEAGEALPLLRDQLRAELQRAAKLTVVATEEERALAAQIRKESFKGNYDQSKRCVLGREVSANASLSATLRGEAPNQDLVLSLFSAESSCSLGVVTLPYNASNALVSVSEGVDLLLSQLRSPSVSMPAKKESAAATPSQPTSPATTPASNAEVSASLEAGWAAPSAWAWTLWGIGATGLAGSVVTGLQAKQAENAANEYTYNGASTAQVDAEEALLLAERTNRLLIGSLLMGVGGYLVWYLEQGDDAAPTQESALSLNGVGVLPMADGLSFGFWGNF